MRITITIDCDNEAFGVSAFDQTEEVARIIRAIPGIKIEDAFERPGDEHWLRDANGNKVGSFVVDESGDFPDDDAVTYDTEAQA